MGDAAPAVRAMGDGMVEERAVLEPLAPPAWLELLLAMGRKSEGTTRVGGALMGALLLRPVWTARDGV